MNRIAVGRAGSLMALERFGEAAAIYGRVLAETGIDGVFPRSVARGGPKNIALIPNAVTMWLIALERTADTERVAGAADAVIKALDPAVSRAHRIAVGEALRLRGVSARAAGDLNAAIKAFDDAINLSGPEQSYAVRMRVCRAMVERARCLQEAGRNQEALEACDATVARFGSLRDAQIQAEVKKARELKRRLAT